MTPQPKAGALLRLFTNTKKRKPIFRWTPPENRPAFVLLRAGWLAQETLTKSYKLLVSNQRFGRRYPKSDLSRLSNGILYPLAVPAQDFSLPNPQQNGDISPYAYVPTRTAGESVDGAE